MMKLPKRWLKGMLIIFGFLFLVVVSIIMAYTFRHRGEVPQWGVSFSKPYAQELGLDWRQTFRSLLTEMGFKKVRLMSYWDEHQPDAERYTFADLDWQFDEAERQGSRVVLAVGLRQPRWPECREPDWAKELTGKAWEDSLMSYLATVVKRYRQHPALEGWLLENEFGNHDFGLHCRDFNRDRLIRELETLRQLDPDHPVMMTLGNSFGLPLRGPRPDVYGLTAYSRVYEARLLKRYINHPAPAWLQKLRAGAIEIFAHKPTVIHELQAEPWTRGPITETSATEQAQTMNPAQLKRVAKYAENTGIKTAYFWGGEWWFWQKTKFNNPAMWDTVKKLIDET